MLKNLMGSMTKIKIFRITDINSSLGTQGDGVGPDIFY